MKIDIMSFFKPSYAYNGDPNIELEYYECEYYLILAPKNSCFFCKYCTDIFFDYMHGPYGFVCTKNKTLDDNGTCETFEEE